MYFNAQSFINKLSELHGLLDNTLVHYDVICVTETWLNDCFVDSLFVARSKYKIFRCDRFGRREGGCAILVNDSLQCNQVSYVHGLVTDDIDMVGVNLECKNQNVVTNCIYNPPRGAAGRMGTLYNIINYLSDKFRHYCIVGDFNLTELYGIINANLPCPDAYGELFDCILSNCLIQYVNRPTHGQNYLDLMFGSQFLDIGLTEVDVPFSTSDHCCIISHILPDERGNLLNAYSYHRKNCMNSDYKAFNDFLMYQNWNEIFSEVDSANEIWIRLYDVINDGLDKFVPNCINKVNNAKRYPPYIRKM